MELQGCTHVCLGRRDAFTVQHSIWENGMTRPKDRKVEGNIN